MVKTNKKLIDAWSIPHFIAGFLFGRYDVINPFQFTLLNAGWEIFENAVLKKHYDIFNTPFGRETVYESPGNSLMDFIITEAGYALGFYLLLEDRPSVDYVFSTGKKDLVVAEIGSWSGRNAFNILNKLSVQHMYLIDPYADYPEYNQFLNQEKLFGRVALAEHSAKNRLQEYDNVSFIHKFSQDAVTDIPECDFIYIDGNHTYEYVRQDINLYYHKVKPSGVIGGHDIQTEDVKRAVFEFADQHSLDVHMDNLDWWIVKP